MNVQDKKTKIMRILNELKQYVSEESSNNANSYVQANLSSKLQEEEKQRLMYVITESQKDAFSKMELYVCNKVLDLLRK